MSDSTEDVAFCTLAIGLEYIMAASILAYDILKHSPGHKLLVLTDKPHVFNQHVNVIAIKFSSYALFGLYHDKRFAIHEALKRFDYAVYLDSDCRVISPPPLDMLKINSNKEILAWNVMSLEQHFLIEQKAEKESHKTFFNSVSRRKGLINYIINDLNIDINSVKFCSEVCLVFSKHSIAGSEFLPLWNKYAQYLQLRGYSWAEGELIGLCANKIGRDITAIDCNQWVFKDVLSARSNIDSELLNDLTGQRKSLAISRRINTTTRFGKVIQKIIKPLPRFIIKALHKDKFKL